MTLAIFSPAAIEPTQVGFLVTGDWCDRCGDQNYDGETRVCLTSWRITGAWRLSGSTRTGPDLR